MAKKKYFKPLRSIHFLTVVGRKPSVSFSVVRFSRDYAGVDNTTTISIMTLSITILTILCIKGL
jgi:hypothetical protein